ncbi:MAG TPA: hypothetical protein VFH39_01920 [Candidatus Saccharimonadales bacterium]|nr:hypothetical protein [Candidatus Saccharimonadales bacterium]
MAERRLLELIYTFFVGVLLALFVGVGINTFYAQPVAPRYPIELEVPRKELSAQQLLLQRQFDKRNEAYLATLKTYNRNVSMLALAAAVILLGLSLLAEKRLKLVANGVMLGGLLTLFYSIGRGFASESSNYTFWLVAISLVIVLLLGFRKLAGRQGSTP